MNDFNPATKNKNMRTMSWLAFFFTIITTLYGQFQGSFPPDYLYLFCSGIILGYFGFSKWGEIKDSEKS